MEKSVKTQVYNGIVIDHSRDNLLTDYAIDMLRQFYLHKNETTVQMGYSRAAKAWSTYKEEFDNELAQRLYNGVSSKYFMFASPVLSNAPNGKREKWGMPISCFLTYVPDTLEGLIEHSTELRWLSVSGGGVGGHWSDVRSVSDIAPGPIPFLHTVDADMVAYRQGRTRKGSYAAYMDIHHPDILEFLNIRIPTGDVQRKALNLHNAINITDKFMNAVLSDEEYELIDPKLGPTGEFLKARKVWQQLLEVRFRTGEPYLNFIDTANRYLPKELKEKGLKIHGSNLCNEIHLPTAPDRTAVCCLSSLNLEYYDDWKDTNLVRDLIRMLDNIIEFFIEYAPDALSRAKYSAMRERSLGLGAMGFHSLLQKRGIAWESEAARTLNREVFEHIKTEAEKETKLLAEERGEAPDMEGSGKRNAHLLAIAPNASSGVILSTSPSIEPFKANAYTHRTRAGSFLVKNKHLEEVLNKYEKNDENTWTSIITSKGSVQHLDFLSDEEKTIFKTAQELDQTWVVTHAADRQIYICQGQSVNLFFPAGSEREYVNKTHLLAWQRGLKGLYYLRTEAKSRAETVADKIERVALEDDKSTIIYGKKTCPFCQMAKDELHIRGIPFEYIDLEEVGKTASEVTGREWKTVPVIYLNGQFIGGYDELMLALDMPVEQEENECVACEG